MSQQFMSNLANLLEKIADHLDAEELQKTASEKEQLNKVADDLSKKLSTIAGEDISVEALEKVATTNPDMFDTLMKIAKKTNDEASPDDVGEPENIRESYATTKVAKGHKKEAAAHADDRFLDWVMS